MVPKMHIKPFECFVFRICLHFIFKCPCVESGRHCRLSVCAFSLSPGTWLKSMLTIDYSVFLKFSAMPQLWCVRVHVLNYKCCGLSNWNSLVWSRMYCTELNISTLQMGRMLVILKVHMPFQKQILIINNMPML